MATKTEHTSSPDVEEPTATIEKIAEQSQRIVTDFIAKQGDAKALEYDPLNIGSAFVRVNAKDDGRSRPPHKGSGGPVE